MRFRILTLWCLLRCVTGDPPAFFNSQEYEHGQLGLFPELRFESTSLRAPQLNFVTWTPEGCQTDLNYFFAPRGMMVGPAGPVIMDADGHMVWHREDFGLAYGFMVQTYRGEDVLTFWSGDDMVVGHGQGYYYMFDKNYRQIHKIGALGGHIADLHEFKITRDNTALLTAYQKVPRHLGFFGRQERQEGWIYDCIFQEIDIETNELLFEWRATDYFRFEDCYNDLRDAGTESNPFDYYHINSVDKDDRGNYIVSARYSHAITYISGQTGEVLWSLGGRHNSFQDLSGGRSTNISWQHDAKWQDDFTTISVFDNAAYFGDTSQPARGLKLRVDQVAMTVELLSEWTHSLAYVSESQGSLQILPNGNAVLGYGSAPAIVEFSPSGEVLCDVHFGALHYGGGGKFSPGAVMSYRAYKQKWKGYPLHHPQVKFKNGRLYVSWNGATEVRTWSLEATDGSEIEGETNWLLLQSTRKMGFETNFTVHEDYEPRFHSLHLLYRLTALDAEGQTLGRWLLDPDGTVRACEDEPARAPPESHFGATGLVLVCVLISVLVAWWKRRELRGWALGSRHLRHRRFSSDSLLPNWREEQLLKRSQSP